MAQVDIGGEDPFLARLFRNPLSFLFLFALIKLIIHLATITGYGIFRDEFYYIACSKRLAFGYVDQPPFSLVLLRLVREILGESVFALRLLPALAGAATVFLSGLMTLKMGGGKLAQALAMTAVIAAPQYLGNNHTYSMNTFDVLFWALSAYLMVLILNGAGRKAWLVLGVVLGLGLLNKISVLWLGFGFFIGLLATPNRQYFLKPRLWLTAAIASALFLPHLLWQISLDWPTLEFIQNATQKMKTAGAWSFIMSQILNMNPVSLPLWAAGLVFYFFLEQGKRYRLLGCMFLTVFLILIVFGRSRAGYLGPGFTWLFPAGALVLERLLQRQKPWPGRTVCAVLWVSGLLTAPLALPVLPVETYTRYAASLGMAPSTEENKEVGPLPQFYADMHGWEEIVATAAEVYQNLTPEEQAKAGFYAPNYGVAGALEHLGKKHGLPTTICAHNNYWLWGLGDFKGDVLIVLGGSKEDHLQVYNDVILAATIECNYCMPYENHRPVWICRDRKLDLAEIWEDEKNFN